MQKRYAGDIDNFLKFGILRKLSPGYRLGMAWWLYPDEARNQNDRHVGYLRNPEQWWKFDPQLFDGLKEIVTSSKRSVRALEEANLLLRQRDDPGGWADPPAFRDASPMVRDGSAYP